MKEVQLACSSRFGSLLVGTLKSIFSDSLGSARVRFWPHRSVNFSGFTEKDLGQGTIKKSFFLFKIKVHYFQLQRPLAHWRWSEEEEQLQKWKGTSLLTKKSTQTQNSRKISKLNQSFKAVLLLIDKKSSSFCCRKPKLGSTTCTVVNWCSLYFNVCIFLSSLLIKSLLLAFVLSEDTLERYALSH